jgi:uncharacterized membrane protein
VYFVKCGSRSHDLNQIENGNAFKTSRRSATQPTRLHYRNISRRNVFLTLKVHFKIGESFMDYLVIVLRLIHIVSGVFWVGSSIVLGVFISPTVAATADAGQKFMAHLVTQTKITMRITIAALLTVLAGGWLYWIDSGGFTSGWTNTTTGWGFSIGGILGIIGLVFGILVGKNTGMLGTIASKVQGRPTSEQMSQIQAAQRQLAVVGPISTIALILALVCMATARYW